MEDLQEQKLVGDTATIPCIPAIVKPKRKKKKSLMPLGVVSLCLGLGIGAGFAIVQPLGQLYIAKQTSSQTQIIQAQETIEISKSQPLLRATETVASEEVVTYIAKTIGPSIVSVYNNKKVSATDLSNYGLNIMDQIVTGLGSGIIFKEDVKYYYIVTNSHVVEGADSLAVNFLGDIKAAGTLVGKDSENDIAVVKVAKAVLDEGTRQGITLAPLGDSDSLEVGQLAVAIGTPATDALNNTVTRGIISAVERTITLSGVKMQLIQTDAAINPGNSGGALVGPTGEVIGINVAKNINAEGIGFAIPINHVKPIVTDLMLHGSVIRPGLGIKGIAVSEANLYDLPIGVYISEVIKGGSADLAGLKEGDLIIQFEEETITTMEQLKACIAQKKVGDIVSLKVIRDKEQKQFKLELREMPE